MSTPKTTIYFRDWMGEGLWYLWSTHHKRPNIISHEIDGKEIIAVIVFNRKVNAERFVKWTGEQTPIYYTPPNRLYDWISSLDYNYLVWPKREAGKVKSYVLSTAEILEKLKGVNEQMKRAREEEGKPIRDGNHRNN